MKKAFRTLSMIMMTSCAMLTSVIAYALPADHYADKSVLASGRWARVKITQGGMHLISDAELRKMGFTDPSKVHVFGLGGRQVSDALCATTPDDLPLQPSIRTDKGIVFFAADQFTWSPKQQAGRPYGHTIHPYSDSNYYFISDIEVGSTDIPQAATSKSAGGETVSEFMDRVVYEKEIEPAADSGSQIYGEDFRTKRSQTFSLAFPDRINDTPAYLTIRFAAKTTNGSSTLNFKANGKDLPTNSNDRIPAVQKSDYYCDTTETSKLIEDNGESLDLTIEYAHTGVLYKARLDYIEAFYTRSLSLRNGELQFHGSFNAGKTLAVSGCSSSTVIWDVTDPAAPRSVEYTLSGDKAMFSLTRSGYREFVAFNPSSVSRAAVADGSVANQNLHGLETPDMLIITYPQYREGAEKIAEIHEKNDGFRVAVINAQEIYNEFSGGKTDVGAFRKLLKMWYDRGVSDDGHSIRYCLIMGKALYDSKMLTAETKNAGYTSMPIYESYDGLTESHSFSCDNFIGMVDDVEENRFEMKEAYVRIAVGRLPVTSGAQALQMAAKIDRYVNNPDLGPWRNKIMLIADDDDGSVHLDQSEDVCRVMNSNGNGGSFIYDKVYLDSYKRVMTGIGPTYPQATQRMMQNYNDGVLFTNYIGHGSPSGWGHEHLWDWSSIISMTNKNLTFMYGATCGFVNWDNHSTSGGEELMLNPDAGIIGMIAASRTVFVDKNGILNKAILKNLFKYGNDGQPLRFGDVYIAGLNSARYSNTLRYVFVGDPAIRIPNPTLSVRINSINGHELDPSSETYPELPAMSAATIEGDIINADGSIASDFNGNVNLQLYDGERVITTFGQGEKGTVRNYNDRDKRLATTTTKAKDGHWSAVLRVPPEIQGNYNTAMIAGYAWDESRVEANGVNTQLYVYGYNEDGEDDKEGPKIEYLYVNTPNFENGGLVNSNPVVMARLSDESGINISDSGIGHAMTLTVDDKDTFSGLSTYFEPDPDNENAGNLIYPITGLSSGRHTLTLTVWDNANNFSKASVDINVGAAVDPVIYGITASTNPASVDFCIALDRPNTALKCSIGIFDLNGRKLWSTDQTMNSDMQSNINTSWDLRDSAGTRVQRGIYIYRVTVETPEGTYSSKSKKIAISAAQ